MAKVVYVSGKITGEPNFELKFAAAETMLKGLGYKVINPARIGAELSPEEVSWEQFIETDFYLLGICDAIFMMEGWESSRGANAEWGYAKALGLEILEEATWAGR